MLPQRVILLARRLELLRAQEPGAQQETIGKIGWVMIKTALTPSYGLLPLFCAHAFECGNGKIGGMPGPDRLARLKGYEGDPCEECGQLTLVRSGACCKCDTCGASSGCS